MCEKNYILNHEDQNVCLDGKQHYPWITVKNMCPYFSYRTSPFSRIELLV